MTALVIMMIVQANGHIVPPLCWILWSVWTAARIIAAMVKSETARGD